MKKLQFVGCLILCIFVLLLTTVAKADPPSRVARLSYISGSVSFSPAGENDWVNATYNRPLITGDKLWVDTDAFAELQLGRAVVRISDSTDLTVLNLDDAIAQFMITQGTINLHVWRIRPGQVYEIDTPNLAVTVRRVGDYRIDVDAEHNVTIVTVRKGRAVVNGPGASYLLDIPQSCQFSGSNLNNYQCYYLAQPDNFDRWCFERDNLSQNAISARYVSPDVIGYEDLDSYGTWNNVQGYGDMWVPNNVPADWAPYSSGHWAWIDPYGWTWIDNEPWGFAPFHYGRWANVRGRWGWMPGPRNKYPVYAPALVIFIGGNNFQLSLTTGGQAGIAWFPLGPGEAYVPPYTASNNYYRNINTSNTRIGYGEISNAYNNPSRIVYKNRKFFNAITAVPTNAFIQSQSVPQVRMPFSKEAIVNAPLSTIATVAPTAVSVVGGSSSTSIKPPKKILNRPAIVNIVPPPPPASFESKQAHLEKHPGKPLAPKVLESLQPTTEVTTPPVTVIGPNQAVPVVKVKPKHMQGLTTPPTTVTPEPLIPTQPGGAQSGMPSAGPSQPPIAGQPPVVTPPSMKPEQEIPQHFEQQTPTVIQPVPTPQGNVPADQLPQTPTEAPKKHHKVHPQQPPSVGAQPLQQQVSPVPQQVPQQPGQPPIGAAPSTSQPQEAQPTQQPWSQPQHEQQPAAQPPSEAVPTMPQPQETQPYQQPSPPSHEEQNVPQQTMQPPVQATPPSSQQMVPPEQLQTPQSAEGNSGPDKHKPKKQNQQQQGDTTSS